MTTVSFIQSFSVVRGNKSFSFIGALALNLVSTVACKIVEREARANNPRDKTPQWRPGSESKQARNQRWNMRCNVHGAFGSSLIGSSMRIHKYANNRLFAGTVASS